MGVYMCEGVNVMFCIYMCVCVYKCVGMFV